MEISALLSRLSIETELMAKAVEVAGPDARPPSCPDWTIRDLVHHTGGVHRWAQFHVAGRRTSWLDGDLPDVASPFPPDGELASWLRAGAVELAATIEDALAEDPVMKIVTFLDAPSPLAFWARRQANETAMHRVDAELPTGRVTPMPSDFAAQGVEEMVGAFITRPRMQLRSPTPRTLGIVANDCDSAWTLHITSDPTVTEPGHNGADCTVRASASDLFKSVWNRPTDTPLVIDGDESVWHVFQRSIHIRW